MHHSRTRPVPNFTRLDPGLPEIAILVDAVLRAREIVSARPWSTSQEPRTEHWWADVLADPRARIRARTGHKAPLPRCAARGCVPSSSIALRVLPMVRRSGTSRQVSRSGGCRNSRSTCSIQRAGFCPALRTALSRTHAGARWYAASCISVKLVRNIRTQSDRLPRWVGRK
jgi:hypothetical protein